MDKETQERTTNQKGRILNLLRDAGKDGVMNTQLSKVALRYNARIQELYVQGYEIEIQHLEGGLSKYILLSEPEQISKKPEAALEIVVNQIKNTYDNKISSEDLEELLQRMNCNVRRNIGTFSR
ncbi:hypothetical protein NV379_02050 [Paenibacillus sp. N1-5-1-14]|uniref:hypothetical protein n=1 Tax=Paenibacillus radicibacter TaxID=2972488 RepID=UPI0021590037|nr:hypothetical protein [Paenibacillus radicibacter]MCR8641428.1 hypothetical protein [Paenibacillus radicibacter]